MSAPLLELENFGKIFRSYWTFRPIPAVRNVNLAVQRGEAFGFLGHNGAGKTTTIKCIVGLIHKSSGHIRLEGHELMAPAQRSIIGYLPEQPYFYDHLRVEETLDFLAALNGLSTAERHSRVRETLQQVGLGERLRSPVRSLSKGLQQRLGLAQAIINRPQLLLLDEPFSGLDPLGRVEVRNLILSLRQQGTTIFMSSHILSDVEDICDRVSIMTKGEVKLCFELSRIAELFGQRFELVLSGAEPDEPRLARLSEHAASSSAQLTAQGTHIRLLFIERDAAEAALSQAVQDKLLVVSFKSCAPSLEEVFVTVTEEARDAEQPHLLAEFREGAR